VRRRRVGATRVTAVTAWMVACVATVASLAAPLATPLAAQVMRYGVVMDGARDSLAAVWTTDAAQAERAYCVTQWWTAASHHGHGLAPAAAAGSVAQRATVGGGDSVVAGGRDADTVYRVLAVRPIAPTEATPNGATFACPTGVPELHTHPPATCYSDRTDQCFAGGADAYSCQPSREDVRKLLQRGDAFAVVQCDAHAFVFYYPGQYTTPPPVVAERTVAVVESRIRDPYTPPVKPPAWKVSKP
jgi:hypothetical protein